MSCLQQTFNLHFQKPSWSLGCMAHALIHENYNYILIAVQLHQIGVTGSPPDGYLQHYEHITIGFKSTFLNHSKIDQLSFLNQIFQNAFFAIAFLLCLFVFCMKFQLETSVKFLKTTGHSMVHGDMDLGSGGAARGQAWPQKIYDMGSLSLLSLLSSSSSSLLLLLLLFFFFFFFFFCTFFFGGSKVERNQKPVGQRETDWNEDSHYRTSGGSTKFSPGSKFEISFVCILGPQSIPYIFGRCS